MISRRLKGDFRLGTRRRYPWIFAILCVGLLAIAYEVGGKTLKIEWVVSILGGVGGLTTFLYTQHLQETRLFTELFQGFNKRYNKLNQRMNLIADGNLAEIRAEERQTLMDYFNLCAEEYLYFDAGYIDDVVWRAWARGMKCYADVPAIRAIWVKELESGSYYGFSMRELEQS